MKALLPFIALPALLLSACVSSNIGAKLDSIGKAVPTIHRDTYNGLYQLNGVYYMECEVRYMRYANVNPKMLDENGRLVDDPDFKAVNDGVTVYVGGSQWTVVDSFANSGPTDRHAVIDYSTGAIHFGDGPILTFLTILAV